MADEIVLDDVAIAALLNDPEGPVGDLLREMTDEGAGIARGRVPVREGNVWSERSTGALGGEFEPKPPGYTKARIHGKVALNQSSELYGSINAPADPTVFLENPARQLKDPRPFLTTALESITAL